MEQLDFLQWRAREKSQQNTEVTDLRMAGGSKIAKCVTSLEAFIILINFVSRSSATFTNSGDSQKSKI